MNCLAHSLTTASRWILLRALVVALPLSAGAASFRAAAKVPPAPASTALQTLAKSPGNEDTDDDEEDSDAEPGDGASRAEPGEPGGYFPGPPGEAGPSATNPNV